MRCAHKPPNQRSIVDSRQKTEATTKPGNERMLMLRCNAYKWVNQHSIFYNVELLGDSIEPSSFWLLSIDPPTSFLFSSFGLPANHSFNIQSDLYTHAITHLIASAIWQICTTHNVQEKERQTSCSHTSAQVQHIQTASVCVCRGCACVRPCKACPMHEWKKKHCKVGFAWDITAIKVGWLCQHVILIPFREVRARVCLCVRE